MSPLKCLPRHRCFPTSKNQKAYLSLDIDIEVGYDVVDILQYTWHILVHVEDAVRSWERREVHLQPRHPMSWHSRH